MAEELSRIKIQNEKLDEIVENKAQTTYHTKMSQLINTAGFVTKDGTVNHAVRADNTQKLTGVSGVNAGTYGPSGNVTIGNTGSGSIIIPQFTVNAQGIVTSVTNRTLKITNKCSNCSHCNKTTSCSETSGCSDCGRSSYSRCSNCGDSP